jgi:hypothetical protein
MSAQNPTQWAVRTKVFPKGGVQTPRIRNGLERSRHRVGFRACFLDAGSADAAIAAVTSPRGRR